MIVGYCQQEFQPLDPKLLFKQPTDKTSLADHQQFYPCSQSVQLSTYDSGFVDDQTVGSLMTPNEINESEEKDEKDKDSAIFRHEKEINHGMDWEGSQVIWSDNSSNKLLVKESLIIKAYEPELNRTTHSVPLYVFPDDLPKRYLPKFTI